MSFWIMKNFARINNHYNNIEAAKEYAATVRQAEALGIKTPILPDRVGWRKLDKITDDLKAKIAAAQQPASDGGEGAA